MTTENREGVKVAGALDVSHFSTSAYNLSVDVTTSGADHVVKSRSETITKPMIYALIPHSHQKLTPLKSGVTADSSAVSSSINREQPTPLLMQLNFWSECGIIQHGFLSVFLRWEQ